MTISDAKKKRGRPRKVRALTSNSNSPATLYRQRGPRWHYSQKQAAEQLGRAHDYLYRQAQRHDLYKPVARLKKGVIYTDYQLFLISLTMRGKLTEDDAFAFLQDADDAELSVVFHNNANKEHP